MNLLPIAHTQVQLRERSHALTAFVDTAWRNATAQPSVAPCEAAKRAGQIEAPRVVTPGENAEALGHRDDRGPPYGARFERTTESARAGRSPKSNMGAPSHRGVTLLVHT